MKPAPDILCIGAAHWDIIGQSPISIGRGADVPGTIRRAPGGVALNIAVGLAAEGRHPALIAAIGTDASGNALCNFLKGSGVETTYLIRSAQTDCYLAIESPDGLIAAIAAADALEGISPDAFETLKIDPEVTVLIDSGLAPPTLDWLARAIQVNDLRLAAASAAKAKRLSPFLGTNACFYLNRMEAETLCDTGFADSTSAAFGLRSKGAARAIITDGPSPICDASPEGLLHACPPNIRPSSITGAGDRFAAAHIAAEKNGLGRSAALAFARDAAARHISDQP